MVTVVRTVAGTADAMEVDTTVRQLSARRGGGVTRTDILGGYLPEAVDEPSVYIEPQSVPAYSGESNDWYYCPGSDAYYPDVQSCSESWVRVPATPQ